MLIRRGYFSRGELGRLSTWGFTPRFREIFLDLYFSRWPNGSAGLNPFWLEGNRRTQNMKLKIILLASLFAFGFAMSATAGAVVDDDNDLVPDQFDNCTGLANGPNEAPENQRDTDADGYGNACDPDYDNDGTVTAGDFATFLGSFGGAGIDTDHDGDGATTTADFAVFLNKFSLPVPNNGPGPSGLDCAGTQPCTP
ncbi:MAG: thrombospondin type 3 repeat-containing protein [Deltaproteobacteria bacterium]|nr:thrombospondin type 3 repeat-containing protein [Deltaproteobacteria bacterium]